MELIELLQVLAGPQGSGSIDVRLDLATSGGLIIMIDDQRSKVRGSRQSPYLS